MKENVGRIDRIARGVIAGGLVAVGVGAWVRESRLAGLFAIVGGALLAESAVTRVCPVSAIAGVDTRSTEERMRDFRVEVNEETERIEHDYGGPLDIGPEPSRDTLAP